jgi:hypothetical protein
MEVFSAFEDERKRHNRFIGDLEQKIGQLKRNDVSLRVHPFIDQLGKAVEELAAVFNEAKVRLYGAIETLGRSAELIGLTPETLAASLNRPMIDDPTDNLILASIIDHAGSRPSERKAFLSENRKDFEDKLYAKTALEGAGVKYFAQASKFLEWRRSQSES